MAMSKSHRNVNYTFLVGTPQNGYKKFKFHRTMHYTTPINADPVPMVTYTFFNVGQHEAVRNYIKYTDMNDVMLESILGNFKRWCIAFITVHPEYDPDNDRILEL